MCQSNTQLILAVASGTEGLELYAAATLSTNGAIYIRKGLDSIGFDELEKGIMNLLPCFSKSRLNFLSIKQKLQ